MSNRPHLIGTRVEAETAAALVADATRRDLTVAQVLRRLVRAHLAEAEKSSARQEAGAEGTLDGSQEIRDAP